METLSSKLLLRIQSWKNMRRSYLNKNTGLEKRRNLLFEENRLRRQTVINTYRCKDNRMDVEVQEINNPAVTVISSTTTVKNAMCIKDLKPDFKQDFLIDGMNVIRAGTDGPIESILQLNSQVTNILVPLIHKLGDSNIHIVFKGFSINNLPPSEIYKLITASLQLHLNQNRRIHLYYVSQKENDKERDDRLLFLLKMRVLPNANLVSNDNFRSMDSHWDTPVKFHHCQIDLIDCMHVDMEMCKRLINTANSINNPDTYELKVESGFCPKEKKLFLQSPELFKRYKFSVKDGILVDVFAV